MSSFGKRQQPVSRTTDISILVVSLSAASGLLVGILIGIMF